MDIPSFADIECQLFNFEQKFSEEQNIWCLDLSLEPQCDSDCCKYANVIFDEDESGGFTEISREYYIHKKY